MTARAVIADASAATFQKDLVDARREVMLIRSCEPQWYA
jgi:hypothetical protein